MSNKPFPEAIPTTLGWAHPLTGEQLTCTKDLADPVDYYKPNRRGQSFLDPEGEINFLVQKVVTGNRVKFSISSLLPILGVEWDMKNGETPTSGPSGQFMYSFGDYPTDKTYAVDATVLTGDPEAPDEEILTSSVVIPAKAAAIPATTTIGGTATVEASATTQLTLTAAFPRAGNFTVTPATATWVSSDPTKATVSAGGLVTGVAAGTTTITATWRGVVDTQVVTVTGGE